MRLTTKFNGIPVEPDSAFESKVSAEVYNSLYPGKNYAAEAEYITSLIDGHAPDKDLKKLGILDVACGTGLHLEQLRHAFPNSVGIDLSKSMIDRARKRLPDITDGDTVDHVGLFTGSMENFSLPRKFGAVTCMFAAIAHACEPDMLESSIQNMADHTVPGGAVMLEPWLSPEEHNIDNPIRDLLVKLPNGDKIMRMNTMNLDELDPNTGEGRVPIRMQFMFAQNMGEKIETDIFVEDHVLGLYSLKTYVKAMEKAGLKDIRKETPPEELQSMLRPLLIGRK